MSIDIDWSKLDEELANKVKDFLNERFQSLPLPSMLKSIQVVSFDFGSIPPSIEIQHVTDPYPEFYEDTYEDEDFEIQRHPSPSRPSSSPPEYTSQDYEHDNILSRETTLSPPDHGRSPRNRQQSNYVDGWAPPFFPQGMGRPFPPFFHSTPGIMSSGISTPSTWMSATGLGPRPHSRSLASASAIDAESVHSPPHSSEDPATSETSTIGNFRPRADTLDTTASSSARRVSLRPLDSLSRPTTAHTEAAEGTRQSDTDIQIIAKITYEGNPRAQIQAELDFNYPSESFISLPIRLTLTGISFSGLAVVASIRNRVHFCLLEEEPEGDGEWEHMLREIRLESEIGDRGKGVLKNVGKVERFLLEQGRRIISEEFVFPSFYTFIL